MEIKMELKNIALSAAQVGLSAAVGVVVLPSALALGAVSTVAYVAKKAEEAGGVALAGFYFGALELHSKLESMKTKEEIVNSPMGDEAVSVN
jgi:hypothetical protein